MNREARRSAARRASKGPAASILLIGGPMDGGVVGPDAPVLRPDWYRTWPAIRGRSMVAIALDRPAVVWPPADQRTPGRYVEDAESSPRSATWQPLNSGEG